MSPLTYAKDIRLVLVTASTQEPLPRSEVKAWLKVPEDDVADDAVIDRLLATARRRIEAYTKRAFMIQTFDAYLTEAPCAAIELPRSPLVGVTSIKGFTDTDATDSGGTAMSSSQYYLDVASEPGQVVPFSGFTFPVGTRIANPAIVRFTAGYTSSSAATAVPAEAKLAITTYVAYLYEHRGDELGASDQLPADVVACLGDLVLPEWG